MSLSQLSSVASNSNSHIHLWVDGVVGIVRVVGSSPPHLNVLWCALLRFQLHFFAAPTAMASAGSPPAMPGQCQAKPVQRILASSFSRQLPQLQHMDARVCTHTRTHITFNLHTHVCVCVCLFYSF